MADDSSTLNILIDASASEAGAARVRVAVQSIQTSTQQSLDKMSSSFDKMDSFIKKATASISAFYAAVAATSVIDSFLDRLIQVNNTYTQFIATMDVVTKSQTESEKRFQFLVNVSNQLGVQVESLTVPYARLSASLAAVSKDGKLTNEIFVALAESSSVLHMRGYESSLMLQAVEQAASKGKVSLEEFQKQLANRLPDAMGIVSRGMSMTTAQFRDAVTKGTLNVYEVILKTAEEIKKEYGGSITFSVNTFNGQLNILKNSVFTLYQTIGQSGAMEGLMNIIKALIGLFNDPNTGKDFGAALKELFNEIANWIKGLTASDIHDFFTGLSGLIKTFVIILESMAVGFKDSVSGKMDWIEFGRIVSEVVLTLTDVVVTFVSALAMIPAGISQMMAYGDLAWQHSKVLKSWISGNETADLTGLDAAQQEVDRANNFANLMTKNLIGTEDSPVAKMRTASEKAFDDLAKHQQGYIPGKKPDSDPKLLDPMSQDQVNAMVAGFPPGASPKDTGKKPENIFNQQSVTMGKAINESMAQYNLLLAGRLPLEDKYQVELASKLQYDKDYLKLSTSQVAKLKELAVTADAAAMKLEAMKQYRADEIAQQREQAIAEHNLNLIRSNANPMATKNQSDLAAKMMFDPKYKAMTQDMQHAEMERAKGLDQLALSTDSATKAQAQYYATLLKERDINQQLTDLRDTGYTSQYTAATQMQSSFKTGGSNQFVSKDDKKNMLANAMVQDDESRKLDQEKMMQAQIQQSDEIEFQLSLLGQSAEMQDRLTREHQTSLAIQKLSVGATDDQLKAYEALEKSINSNMNSALNKQYASQRDMIAGLKDGMQAYLDSIKDVRKEMGNFVNKELQSMVQGFGDAVAGAVMGTKDIHQALDDLGKQVLTQIISQIVQMGVQWAIQAGMAVVSHQTIAASHAAMSATMTATGAAATVTQTATSTAAAAETTAAWAPAAGMTSIGSFGTAAVIALGAIAAVLAFTKGFKTGGFTGNGGIDEIAGVVHGQEFVMPAAQTAMYRGVLESMKNGTFMATQGDPSSGIAANQSSDSVSSGISLEFHNHGNPQSYTAERISEDRIRIIARDEATSAVHQHTPSIVANQLGTANSPISTALNRNTLIQRRRNQ